MRKLLLLLSLCVPAFAANTLSDLLISSGVGAFTPSGSTYAEYTMEFRFTNNSGTSGLYGAGNYLCTVSGGLGCLSGYGTGESNYPVISVTTGSDYRVRYIHSSAGSYGTLQVWNGDCSIQIANKTNTLGTPQPIQLGASFNFNAKPNISFSRLYSGLTGSGTGCPVDRPATPANLWDYRFEDSSGNPNLADASGNSTSVTLSGASYTQPASTTYPLAVSIQSTTPYNWFSTQPSTPYNITSTTFSSNWPGTGAPSSISWTQTGKPTGATDCTLTNTTTNTVTANCPTSTINGLGDYQLQLAATDGGGTVTSSIHVGIVPVDSNGNVVIPSTMNGISTTDFIDAIANAPGKLLAAGKSPLPWMENTEKADADLMAIPFATAPNMVAGAGTMTIPSTGINSFNPNTYGNGQINANAYNGIAVQNSGANVTSADYGTFFELTWDADNNGTNQGHFVFLVYGVDVPNNRVWMGVNQLLEPYPAFASGLSWHRMGVGAGSCSGLAATISGGQVTGITGANTCSGFHWWLYNPPVVLVSGVGACSITAVLQTPNTTTNSTQWGKVSSFAGNFPCGSGVVGTPSVTIAAATDFSYWDQGSQGDQIFNYYETGLALARLWLRTGLTAYQTEWHNDCTNAWRYSMDSGYNQQGQARNSSWDMYMACGLDPTFTLGSLTHAQTAGEIFAGTAWAPTRTTGYGYGGLDGIIGPNPSFTAPNPNNQSGSFVVNPQPLASSTLTAGFGYRIYSLGTTNWNSIASNQSWGGGSPVVGGTFVATGAASGTGTVLTSDVGTQSLREVAYGLRATAKLAKHQGNFGLPTTWCGYLTNQMTYYWNYPYNLTTPTGDTTGSAFYPEDDFYPAFHYPYLAYPGGTTKFGVSPWRVIGLSTIALSDAYEALNQCGDTTNAATTLTNLVSLANFNWNYGVAPDGGSFYDVNYGAIGITDAASTVTYNAWITGSNQPSNITINTTNGSKTVTANVGGFSTNFTRQFCAAGGAASCNMGAIINGVSVTVDHVVSDSHLELASNWSTTNYSGDQISSICSMTVTNGSASATGSMGCRFQTFFAGYSGCTAGVNCPYVAILSGACSSGGYCAQSNSLGYEVIAVGSDTSVTFNNPFLGTSGTYTTFIYAPPAPTLCGTSKAKVCELTNGRSLSQDTCYIFAWEWWKTGNTAWQDKAKFCLNKQYGGAAPGYGSSGTPTGYSVYSFSGTLTATGGSTAVTGSGTTFTSQFTNGDTIVIADGISGGTCGSNPCTWANYPNGTPTYYVYTVTVTDDTHLTLSANYAGSGTATTLYYNPKNWNGADGGVGYLGTLLPSCSVNTPPCDGWNFTTQSGKYYGVGMGAGNVPLALGLVGYTATTSGGVAGKGFRFGGGTIMRRK